MALAERLQIPLRDTAVTRAARSCPGDGDTFADLVQQYDRTVHNVIRAMVHNPQDVEDVSQEVWIKVANNLANLRDQSRFLPWLYRISRNCALNFLSTQKNRQQVANTDDEDQVEALASPVAEGPEAQAISVAERREVWAALAALSDADRTVLLLREFHELPYADIASQLHISRGNAEVRVFRARSRFRQQFTRREGAMARGFLGMPLFGVLGKIQAVFGAASAASTPTAATATVATTAAATTGTGVAAEVGIGLVAKLLITVAALSVTAGAVSVAVPGEVEPEAVSAPVAAVAVASGLAFSVPSVAVTNAAAPGVSSAVAAAVDSRSVPLPVEPKAFAPASTAPALVTLFAQPAMVPAAEMPLQFPVLATATSAIGVAPSAIAPTLVDATTTVSGSSTATDAGGPGGRKAPGNNGQDRNSASDHGNANANGVGQGGNGGQDRSVVPDHGNSSANVPVAGPPATNGQDRLPAAGHGTSNANALAATSSAGNRGQDKALASDHGNGGDTTTHGRGAH